MNKKFKLSDIVNIRSGMVVPKTVNNDEKQLTDAYVRMVGTSDYDDDGNLRNDLEANVLIKPAIEKISYNITRFYSMQREDAFLPPYSAMNIHLLLPVLLFWF